MERKGKMIPRRESGHRKGAENNSGNCGERSLEAESIRSRAESTGGKLKAATEINKKEQCA